MQGFCLFFTKRFNAVGISAGTTSVCLLVYFFLGERNLVFQTEKFEGILKILLPCRFLQTGGDSQLGPWLWKGKRITVNHIIVSKSSKYHFFTRFFSWFLMKMKQGKLLLIAQKWQERDINFKLVYCNKARTQEPLLIYIKRIDPPFCTVLYILCLAYGAKHTRKLIHGIAYLRESRAVYTLSF